MTRFPAEVEVLVIGAGFGGICAAIQLSEHGRQDFAVLEQSNGLGGVWFDNTYPGAACDILATNAWFAFRDRRIHGFLYRQARRT
jgi:cation diffusion facilitator CzcD-associated flavoprotein CzcO